MNGAAIIGVGQVIQRPGDTSATDARGPIELMVEAARRAAADCGAPGVLDRVGWIGAPAGAYAYRNPAALVAEHLGVRAVSVFAELSGTTPHDMVFAAAQRIAAGQLDVALVVGGEAAWSAAHWRRHGVTPGWDQRPGGEPAEIFPGYPAELFAEAPAYGSGPAAYALLEDSRRAALGRTPDQHRRTIAALWQPFSAVAAANPYAWDRRLLSAAEIAEPSPDNRMVATPYTKAMVANNTVDMASAVLVCSVEVARAAGVAADRMVFPHTSVTAHETWRLAARDVLHRGPALAAAARLLQAHSGVAVSQAEHLDLYACFPSMVQLSVEALAVDSDRPLTVTGGLALAGAALCNAVGHSIAAMVERVRHGGCGVVQANGGIATKHALGLYTPFPPKYVALLDAQDSVDHRARSPLDDAAGPVTVDVTVEAATVEMARDGTSRVLAAVLDHHGRRGFATSSDGDLVAAAGAGALTGAAARRVDGRLLVD